MANPNDINKKLNDSLNALQDMSAEHLQSVGVSVLEQRKVLKGKTKLDQAITKKFDLEKDLIKKISESESKIDRNRSIMTSVLLDGISQTSKGIKSQTDFIKSSLIADKKSFTNVDKLLGNLTVKNDITKDTTNAFLKEENPLELQLELLKSINEKVGGLTGVGGKTAGLFDFLINGLPKILSSLGDLAIGGGELALGAGVGAGLGKYSKWFKMPRLKKAGQIAGKVMSKAKSPLGLAAGGVAAGGAILLGTDVLEGRAKGGSIKSNTPYIVGEKGPELFMSNDSGKIVPNNRLGGSIGHLLQEQNDQLNKGFAATLKGFTKPLTKSVKGFASTINDKTKSFIGIFKAGWTYLKDSMYSIYNRIISLIPKSGDSSTPPANPGAVTPPVGSSGSTVAQSTPPAGSSGSSGQVPQNYHGAFKVPETGIRKLHNGEMVLPAYEAEMVRSASELRSNYSIKSPSRSTITPKLDESFWMKKFVPAFANAIKVDKKQITSGAIRSASNPFG